MVHEKLKFNFMGIVNEAEHEIAMISKTVNLKSVLYKQTKKQGSISRWEATVTAKKPAYFLSLFQNCVQHCNYINTLTSVAHVQHQILSCNVMFPYHRGHNLSLYYQKFQSHKILVPVNRKGVHYDKFAKGYSRRNIDGGAGGTWYNKLWVVG